MQNYMTKKSGLVAINTTFLSQGFAFMLFCPDKPFQLLLIYLPNYKDADLSS